MINKSKKEINIFSSLSSNDIFERMNIADFGILPASSVSIEAISIGMPFMVGYYADNQLNYYHTLTKKENVFGLDNLLKLDSLNIDSYDNKNYYSYKINSTNLKKIF